jgi:Cation efflux system protein CusB domain 1
MKNPKKLPLFREEALEYSAQRPFLSDVILTTPISFWASTITLMGFIVLGLCFSTTVKISRSSELLGRVEAQPQKGGKVFAQLWADANTVDTFVPGQEVQVKYDAFPLTTYGVFEGRVKSIANQPIMTTSPQSTSAIPLYPVKVEMKEQNISVRNKLIPLRPGMTLSAKVVLEHKTLLNWLVEPPKRSNGND